MDFLLETDLKRLAALAYHRLDWSSAVVRKFHRRRKTLETHADFPLLKKVYEGLFVPLTLWPVDLLGLFTEALARVEKGKRLSGEMRLLINILPSLPGQAAQNATMEHEHAVQHGKYESLIRAPIKFDAMEQKLAADPAFQADWQAIRARFDIAKYQDGKRIIRRVSSPSEACAAIWRFAGTPNPRGFKRSLMFSASAGTSTGCSVTSRSS